MLSSESELKRVIVYCLRAHDIVKWVTESYNKQSFHTVLL